MKEDLQQLLAFVEFTTKFQQVKRIVMANGEDRLENDSEHSYQLAIVAWYLIQKEKLNLNVELVLKYCLVHDLVEIYAGDTYFYSNDKNLIDGKAVREADALKRIKEEFPNFESLFENISEYETHESSEAKFVYALDKVLPAMNIFLDDGRSWQTITKDIEKKIIKEKKTSKVSLSPDVLKYWNEFLILLEENQDHLFLKK